MLIPRPTLAGTRADGEFLESFWQLYVRARDVSGDETPFGDATAVFDEAILAHLRSRLHPHVLRTPVFFTDRLSNRVLAGCLLLRDGSCAIALNARFITDPEVFAHTLVEEFVHAQQIRDGTNFEAQRRQYPYAERPYEREAKLLATEILGYEPEARAVVVVRPEPSGPLFDRRA